MKTRNVRRRKALAWHRRDVKHGHTWDSSRTWPNVVCRIISHGNVTSRY